LCGERDVLRCPGFSVSGEVRGRLAGPCATLREHDPDYVLLDGLLSEGDRLGDGRAHYSFKHRRHGVNMRDVPDPEGQLLRISPALPGRAHDLAAARTHRIIRIRERQGVPIVADRASIGAWATTAIRRPSDGELSPTERALNRALAQARAPVERGVARLKSWRIFRRSRCSPNRMTDIAAAVLTLERQR